jgi:hypothetical protein
LSKSVGGSVASDTSSSSLQLSLENQKVVATVDEYVRDLAGIVNGQSDVIGYAFAVNGKINSADVYVSNALFKKLWPKMLKASATEAVSEANQVRLADPVKAASVKSFMADADKAESNDRALGAGATLRTRENKENVLYEARDEKTKVVVHKSYVKKN